MTRKKEPEPEDVNDIANAWICFFGLYIELDDIDLQTKTPSPEVVAIKRDLFNKLSKEAKEVISVLLQSPAELENFCKCLSTGKWKNRKGDNSFFVERYFRKNWRSRIRVKSVFAELRKFVREFEL